MENLFFKGAKVIELGGGSNPVYQPNVDVRAAYDAKGQQMVAFTCDFNNPAEMEEKIGSDEFDGVFCRYVIEHLSWRQVRAFLQQVRRILKPGGKAVFITADVDAQIRWIKDHPEGWDGRDAFDSFSCVLFGDQDYPENAHKNYMNSLLLNGLLKEAGFASGMSEPYGERKTDLFAVAVKGHEPSVKDHVLEHAAAAQVKAYSPLQEMARQMEQSVESQSINQSRRHAFTREEMYDKHYFHGGAKVGGYAHEGYWDYPVHEVTLQHILDVAPGSVMEIGCARGYLLKRLQDRGLHANGLEISRHCWLTRVCDGIINRDICSPERWPWKDQEFDLAFSIAVLEHIPEGALSHVLSELKRTCRRGLHGVDFGEHDDGFDKTHCTLHPRQWWIDLFARHGLHSHQIVDKEELERGEVPPQVLAGDGKVKLNVGCFTTMFHHGWVNMDVKPLQQFAEHHKYLFRQYDARTALPYDTGTVDLIYCSHLLDHLGYADGLSLLRDFRRVIKPEDGAVRLIVSDANRLLRAYLENPGELDEFAHINDGVENAKTSLVKVYEMLCNSRASLYDTDTLLSALDDAGFIAREAHFRCNRTAMDFKDPIGGHPGLQQILRETLDVLPCCSLYVVAVPKR